MCGESLARDESGIFSYLKILKYQSNIEISGKYDISDFSNIGSVFEYCSASKVRYIRLQWEYSDTANIFKYGLVTSPFLNVNKIKKTLIKSKIFAYVDYYVYLCSKEIKK